ncbi:Aldehyde ferredoxin oxidoreductase [Desulfofundulus kuznetsovii DSM 6115]|uniref:Aldehyde ferredoxin oxidoreductase n=1 Tax=Desulfofundulus kuznetsovii (strain DSM 6115 / VKM B-1805 / 17) TaxID=760568 RepID=A0AAU8PW07_DESK7|nr:Aldehyde ferredoxin oxidoreductase [Desulfofundulus kuznetsovii DSM 6115]
MGYGFTGKILLVDLTKSEILVEKPAEEFYRQYLGGPGIGLYYLLKNNKRHIDPLGPENTLVFAPGLLTGTSAPCVPRYTVLAKSPLTGALGKSEAGGWWGPELKRAGFDAVVVRGRAPRPVYLWIKDGEAEIRDASHLWGLQTGEVQEGIRRELGDEKVQVAQIGPAGEKLVRFANICNNLAHFNGRNGLGAVMGSKNLRAIAVRGTRAVEVKDRSAVGEVLRWVTEQVNIHPLSAALHEHGTPIGITSNNAGGCLPTNNWDTGFFERAEEIGSEELIKKYLVKRGGCFACPIRCKRVVEVKDENITVDKRYGGPEYEALAALGSNCGISNLKLIIKANELCNRYGLDIISLGMTISFAMKCYEEGIIDKTHTDGLDLRFGNEEVLLPLIEKIANREGFGNVLADGSRAAAARFGKKSEEYLIEVKGQEVPMHDPRVKSGVGLQFALAVNGADHWFAQHDPFFTSKDASGVQAAAAIGLGEAVEANDLSYRKVRHILYTSYLNGVYDMLGVCVFGYIARSLTPLDKLLNLVEAVTGWKTSWWELLKAGERFLAMAKEYNARQGLTFDDDRLPEKFFTSMNGGPRDGEPGLDRDKFYKAVRLFYEMAGWEVDTGRPAKAKLYELGLDWLVEE